MQAVFILYCDSDVSIVNAFLVFAMHICLGDEVLNKHFLQKKNAKALNVRSLSHLLVTLTLNHINVFFSDLSSISVLEFSTPQKVFNFYLGLFFPVRMLFLAWLGLPTQQNPQKLDDWAFLRFLWELSEIDERSDEGFRNKNVDMALYEVGFGTRGFI